MAHDSKYPPLHWHEYAPQLVQKYNLVPTGKQRYNGPCPACGGTDRFWISSHNNEVRVNCNQCKDWKAIYEEMQADCIIPPPRESRNMNVVSFERDNLSDFDSVVPYYERKGVPLGSAKADGTNTLVPVYKIDGRKLVKIGKQTILADGKKLFDKGMSQDAAFSPVGGTPEGTTYIAEGWATASSVQVCMGRPCIFALNSGNLPKVAKILQETFPDVNFIVAADNDEAGIKAAKETGLLYRAPKQAGADWNDVHQTEGAASVKKQLGSVKPPKPLFVPLGDLEFKAPQWIIDGLIEQDTFSVCFGAPAAGKTFLVLDMALCIATGKQFHGRDVKQGPVFYIAGEGHNGFARRAAAWSKANGIDLKGVPFFKSSRSIVLTEEASVDEMMAVIEEMVQQHGEPQIIVVDTLARAMGAADENSSKDMGAAIAAVDEMRDMYGCTVVAVHHVGHGNKERARGSSALLGAVDCEFRVEKWSGDDPIAKIEVAFTKMKDAPQPDNLNFAHCEIELMGADMEYTQSVVLEPIDDGRPKGGNGPRLTGHKKRFMDALDEAKPLGENKADVAKVRDNFYQTLVDVQDASRRKIWTRAFQAVTDMGLISSSESLVFDERDRL